MIIKNLVDEDFINYKNPSMVIAFHRCKGFKCGKGLCQNSPLATSPDIEIEPSEIVKRYMDNNLTSSIVMAGLDPIDTFSDLIVLIEEFREVTNDDIVVFTGYNKDEIAHEISILSMFKNITVKFGRYIPNQNSHYDEVLGVNLASDNQYAEKIS